MFFRSKKLVLISLLLLSAQICACGKNNEATDVSSDKSQEEFSAAIASSEGVKQTKESTNAAAAEGASDKSTEGSTAEKVSESASEKSTGSTSESSSGSTETEDPGEILDFVDVFGEHYQTQILPTVQKHEYSSDKFVHDGHKLTYEDDKCKTRFGVDVSRHQGKINWEKVKAAGIEFAIIRIAYRGYGTSGDLNLDQRFYENIQGAQAAGLDVGVYIFSQAINEEEALEEANFVIEHLKGYELQLPVVYDPESILDAEARTDNVSGEQFTKNTIVFCDAIKKAGFEPMIYSNMLWEAFEFDLTQLDYLPIWYADYEVLPQTPYHFEYWQYTNTGRVSGIDGGVDLNIQFIEK